MSDRTRRFPRIRVTQKVTHGLTVFVTGDNEDVVVPRALKVGKRFDDAVRGRGARRLKQPLTVF
jgi:hypothetical protein